MRNRSRLGASVWSAPLRREIAPDARNATAAVCTADGPRNSLRALLPPISEPAGTALCAIAILTGFRFLLAGWMPLSFDEAYYWLWSKHLALGYFEHPAAIALAIRAGTAIFGDTELGVRFVPLLASLVASWAVWRSAALLLASGRAGAMACLLFNATLMVAAETMGATPDSLLIAAAALLLWSVAKLQITKDGRWWIAAGAAAGAALATKY
ncbi:MAG TPA: glycosyltransferase family 39 protein, partial [Rhizomicrobium sp.]